MVMSPDGKSKTIKKATTLGQAMAAKAQKKSSGGQSPGSPSSPTSPSFSPPKASTSPEPSSPPQQRPSPPKSTILKGSTGSPGQRRASGGSAGGLTKSSSAVKIVDMASPADTTASTAAPSSPNPAKGQRPTSTSGRMASSRSAPDLVEVGGGFKSKRTGYAPKPALGPKNDFFEAGERMEATKWQRWAQQVDKRTLGAHYAYQMADLPAAIAMPDPNQQEHDDWMTDALHKKRPEEASHPREKDAKPSMHTAFNDRSARMREGKGLKTTLMASDQAPTEWGWHGDCSCPVCKPQHCRPAGQPSHHVHSNKVPRCNKDSTPTQPAWELEKTHTFNSDKLATAVAHPDRGAAPVVEEKAFAQNMGRKIKPANPTSPGAGALSHRSFSTDSRPIAGDFDQEARGNVFPTTRSKSRQRWQGRAGDVPNRSGVALVLSARTDDPPAPSQVCASRKADGHFKSTFSSESEQFSQYYNQEMFRFADARSPRGRSQPPPSRDPELAGMATGVKGSHLFNCGNPLTMRGKDRSPTSLCSSRNLSPKATFRSNPGNNSSAMNSVINHDIVEQGHANETAWRMQMDVPFMTLCGHTVNVVEKGREHAESIKSARGHVRSTGISSNLQWSE